MLIEEKGAVTPLIRSTLIYFLQVKFSSKPEGKNRKFIGSNNDADDKFNVNRNPFSCQPSEKILKLIIKGFFMNVTSLFYMRKVLHKNYGIG